MSSLRIIRARWFSTVLTLRCNAPGRFLAAHPFCKESQQLSLSRRQAMQLRVLAHDRRRILHFNVTAHPTADWTGQQLREAFPFDQLPRYLLRDRDAIFGNAFRRQVRDMGIHEVLGTPRSPWQRAYVERVVGSIRRECLDHGVLQKHTDKEFIMN